MDEHRQMMAKAKRYQEKQVKEKIKEAGT